MILNRQKTLLFLASMLLGGPLFSQCVVTITCPSNIVLPADTMACTAAVSYADPVTTNSCSTPGTLTLNYTGSLQTFTVPAGVTSLHIDASGAQGGSISNSCSAPGGLGARMEGDFVVTPGEVLNVMVGQQGLTNGSDAGGGGGTFVVRTGNVCLVAAGGGGGATNNINQCGSNLAGINASITTSGTASGNGLVAGGTNGNGGGASGGSGGGGGGFLTDGTAGTGLANNNGKAYVNGGAGGTGNNNDFGGYGGGGAGWFTGGNGGGGGGYSGGGTSGSQPFTGGGGGGSYNAGTNQVNAAGFQTGNGRVIFTYTLSAPTYTTMTQGLASGSAFPVGVTTMAFTVTDSAGASDSCSFTVTVQDLVAPTIFCGSNIAVSNDPGTCGAPVIYNNPAALDECPGVAVNLVAGLPSGSTFLEGVTTVTFEAVDSSGNVDSCSFTVTVTVDDSSSQAVEICDGDVYSIGNNNYSVAGLYVDTLQNGGGCDSVVTTTLTVAAAINTGTTVNGGSISANASGATYQWIDCDNANAPIPGATGQSFVAPQDGNYAVIVSIGNCADTSACSVVVGMVDGLHTSVVLYPNPTSGSVNLSFGTAIEALEIEVYDIAGKQVLVQSVANAASAQVDMSRFQNGVYFLKLRTAEGQEMLRVVKQD
jgi:hypothetical protein